MKTDEEVLTDYDKLYEVVRKYLRLKSLDGKPERQDLRKELAKLVNMDEFKS